MPNQPKGYIRYRLSRGVAAEINNLRDGGGYLSWDDFFSAMARKWKETPNELAPANVKAGFEMIRIQLIQLEDIYRTTTRSVEIQSATLEGMQDTVQSLNATQEQTQNLLQQFTNLLSIAFGPEESKSETPATGKPMSKLEQRIRSKTP